MSYGCLAVHLEVISPAEIEKSGERAKERKETQAQFLSNPQITPKWPTRLIFPLSCSTPSQTRCRTARQCTSRISFPPPSTPASWEPRERVDDVFGNHFSQYLHRARKLAYGPSLGGEYCHPFCLNFKKGRPPSLLY